MAIVGLWDGGPWEVWLRSSLGPTLWVLEWHKGASGHCLAGLFLTTVLRVGTPGVGWGVAHHRLGPALPHTHTHKSGVVLHPSEAARAIGTLCA